MAAIWAGLDAGKTHHHCVVIDGDGKRLLSRRVPNNEADLLRLIADVDKLGEVTAWGLDLADGGAALAIAVLLDRNQHLLYIPGRAVNRAAEGYRGDGKTDAKDAAIIADQARIRRDLTALRPADDLVAELKMLTAHRLDLVGDRTRAVNRLRILLTGVFPGLEAALDLGNIGPLVLLTGWQTPAAIRQAGAEQLAAWLHEHRVRGAAKLAAAAIAAAEAQHTRVPGEDAAAALVADQARDLTAMNRRIDELDKLIADRFSRHRHAEVIASMPGIGTVLGAEFLAATGGDMTLFAGPDQLAAFGGVAPSSRDSGQVSGNNHRPRRYSRRLQRVLYTSALISIRCCDQSRRFYDRKRAEGKRHVQAVLALARRRVNVLWALLRDGRRYNPAPPLALAA